MEWPFRRKKIQFGPSLPEPIPYCTVHEGCTGFVTKKDGEEILCEYVKWKCEICTMDDFDSKGAVEHHMATIHPEEY